MHRTVVLPDFVKPGGKYILMVGEDGQVVLEWLLADQEFINLHDQNDLIRVLDRVQPELLREVFATLTQYGRQGLLDSNGA